MDRTERPRDGRPARAIGLILSAASATANQTPGPALPETSLGQPGTPPKNPPSGSKTTKPAPNAAGPALPAPTATQGTLQPTPAPGAVPQPIRLPIRNRRRPPQFRGSAV